MEVAWKAHFWEDDFLSQPVETAISRCIRPNSGYSGVMRFHSVVQGLAAAALCSSVVLLGACDGHQWSETSRLFKPHGGEHASHEESLHSSAAHESKNSHGEHHQEGEKATEVKGEARTLGLDSK